MTNPDEANIGTSPDRSNGNDYLSIASGDVSVYKFLSDAYHYTGGFRTGKYLVPYPIEGFYDARRDFSHYVNFFGAIVDAMIDPVFAKPVKRDLQTPRGVDVEDPFWGGFVDNCTNSGVSLSKFMKESVAVYTRIHSEMFIIVDNFADQPEDAISALNNRTYPYIYSKTAEDIFDFVIDEFGKLLSITFYAGTKTIKDRKGTETNIQLYRLWDSNRSIQLMRDDKSGKVVELPETERIHDLGVLPVVIVSDSSTPAQGELLPDPKLYGVGRVCLTLFNKDSEMRELERKQEFSLLAIPGNRNGDQAIGAGNILYYPKDSSGSPGWLSPDAATLKGLLDTRNSLREDLYGLAEQHGVVAHREAKSGIALAYEFQAHKNILDATASFCEKAEHDIFNLFSLYMNWGDKYVYSVEYDDKYLPFNTAEKVEQDQFLIDSGIPDIFKVEIWKDHFKRRFPDATSTQLNDMVDEAEAMLKNVSAQFGNV